MNGVNAEEAPGIRSAAGWSMLSHNWVTYVLVRFFCRSREQEFSFMLYQYFRRLDDRIDDAKASEAEKTAFLARERSRIEGFYDAPAIRAPDLAAQIVRYDRGHGRRLRPWIERMFEVFEFDARRTGRRVDREAILDYSRRLAEAYTRLLLDFIEPRYPYDPGDARLAHACHLLHMLRDHEIDQDLGYCNIGRDEAEQYGFKAGETSGEGFQKWLVDRVDMAEGIFQAEKPRILALPFGRVKVIAWLYCFRYRQVLKAVRRHGLPRRSDRPARTAGFVRLAGELAGLIIGHAWQRMKLL